MGLSCEKLRQYSYFASLSDESLRILAEKVKAIELTACARIITEGIPTDAFLWSSTAFCQYPNSLQLFESFGQMFRDEGIQAVNVRLP